MTISIKPILQNNYFMHIDYIFNKIRNKETLIHKIKLKIRISRVV